MKILIVSLNREHSPYPVAPIGALSIAASALKAGFETDFIDCSFVRHPTKIINSYLKKNIYSVIGFSIRNLDNCFYFKPKIYFEEIRDIINQTKNHTDAKIVAGGSGFSMAPYSWMKKNRYRLWNNWRRGRKIYCSA